MRMVESDGRQRRNLSSLTLDALRSSATPERRAAAGISRRDRASAGKVVKHSPGSPCWERGGVLGGRPEGWRSPRPPRPKASAKVGDKPPSEFGVEAMLD